MVAEKVSCHQPVPPFELLQYCQRFFITEDHRQPLRLFPPDYTLQFSYILFQDILVEKTMAFKAWF